MKPSFTTTISLTAEEKDQTEQLRANGYKVIQIYRLGLQIAKEALCRQEKEPTEKQGDQKNQTKNEPRKDERSNAVRPVQ